MRAHISHETVDISKSSWSAITTLLCNMWRHKCTCTTNGRPLNSESDALPLQMQLLKYNALSFDLPCKKKTKWFEYEYYEHNVGVNALCWMKKNIRKDWLLYIIMSYISNYTWYARQFLHRI